MTLVSSSCPCDDDDEERLLKSGGEEGYVVWKLVYMSCVLVYMFGALISDRMGADMVMVSSLALCMASEMITVEEGVAGFANEGVLTVVVLFVVAAGISLTGALDWYMNKLLGQPKTTASAQLRLMIPITIVSAFLNNTPVVAVMIPIVQKWGSSVNISPQQLLVPLSFASIFGGTCTLIGTSTNLVVLGLLQSRYNNTVSIGLFDLAVYGIPLAIVGMTYLMLMSPYLLPSNGAGVGSSSSAQDNILMGARLTQWSTAAGRSVKRSGLRDTGGIYLVSVHRATTGNIHRAVGQDFVLHEGDILYFTTAGNLQDFGPFCDLHGLEVITNETTTTTATIDDKPQPDSTQSNNNHHPKLTSMEHNFTPEQHPSLSDTFHESSLTHYKPTATNLADALKSQFPTALSPIVEHNNHEEDEEEQDDLPEGEEEIGQWSETERLVLINRITDKIRNVPSSNDTMDANLTRHAKIAWEGPPQIVVGPVNSKMVVIAINAKDRPGLLLDLSRGLLRLRLNFHHTEASVVAGRSLSIWRCEVLKPKKEETTTTTTPSTITNMEEIYSVLHNLLEVDNGVEAVKRRGLKVIRAEVLKHSRLEGKTAQDADFRTIYKAAIVSVQRPDDSDSVPLSLSQIRFRVGDLLILQATDDSPLLQRPPSDFYTNKKGASSSSSLTKLVRRNFSFGSASDLEKMDAAKKSDEKKNPPDIADVEQQIDPVLKDTSDQNGFFIGGVEEDDTMDPEQETKTTTPPVVVMEHTHVNENEIPQATLDIWKDVKVSFPDEDKGVGREFLTAMVIASHSKLAQKSAMQSGLHKLPGVVLVSIDRPQKEEEKQQQGESKTLTMEEIEQQSESSADNTSIRNSKRKMEAITPSDPLQEGDVLWFAGSASAIGDLRKIPGWKSYLSDEVKKVTDKVHDRRLVQAVIARKGPLVGKTVRDVRFRTKYGAAVISIHREGNRVHDHPSRIKLHGGDVLLLEAGPTFIKEHAENDKSFALLSEVRDSAPPRLRLLVPALALAVAMLAVYTANLSSLLVCSLIAAGLMIFLGILSQQEARDAVNWEVYVTIASAFGIGSALTNSGVAKAVADALVKIGTGMNMGDAGLYGAVYFATFLISNVVTNNAAAALLFPIAMDAAEQTNADLKLMSFALMLGASASFMSPFGYTTNLLIYGPGGYKYMDFIKIGTPLQIVLWIISIVLLSVKMPFYISWVATASILLLTVIILINNPFTSKNKSK